MLYKRPGSDHWQIKFSINKRTIRRSSQTSDKRLAERIEHSIRAGIIEAQIAGVKPPFSWEQATELWYQEKQGKRSIDTDLAIFRSMDEYFKGEDVKAITAKSVAQYRTVVAMRASASTANRHVALLRSLLRRLEVLEIIDKAPAVELLPTETKEPAWITPEQITAVLNALPAYARDIAEFAVLTGLRRGNVLGLLWSWLDVERNTVTIPAMSAKGKRTIVVPLSVPAMEVLERRVSIDPVHVFTGPLGGVLETIKRPWATAVEAAGVPNLRFHDLRHAWASMHTLNKTPDRVLQALGGWSSPKMLERYAHLKPGALAEYAGNVFTKKT